MLHSHVSDSKYDRPGFEILRHQSEVTLVKIQFGEFYLPFQVPMWTRKEVPRSRHRRALSGAGDLMQLEPNLERAWKQDLESRRWTSRLCLGSVSWPPKGKAGFKIPLKWISLFSAPEWIQPSDKLVGISSWVLCQSRIEQCNGSSLEERKKT